MGVFDDVTWESRVRWYVAVTVLDLVLNDEEREALQ